MRIGRRSLIVGAAMSGLALPVCARSPVFRAGSGQSGSISPDGSVITGQSGGGGSGTLLTRYGTWSFGSEQALQPGYGGGTFCEPLLNSVSVSMGQWLGIVPLPAMQQLRVNFGGNLYGITFDQLWYSWSNWNWQGNDGADLASGPASTPTPPPLPSTYAPPYTPSPDGTTITGGSGTLQTTAGVWTFGSVNGGGWNINLNGIPIGNPNYAVTQLTVNAFGQLFFKTTDLAWHLWAGNQANPSTGPTSSPVPIGATFSPTHLDHYPTGNSIGTLVSTFSVAMSDGSGYSGTTTLTDTASPATSYFGASGSTIVTTATPIPASSYIPIVHFTQNGSGYMKMLSIGVG